MAIDKLKVAKRLREAGFTEAQAEAVIAAVQEGAERADLATKADLALLNAELRAEIASVRSEMREMEQRLVTRIEAVRTDIEAAKSAMLYRMLQTILGAVLVNLVAMAGLMFGLVKLLGH